MAIEIQGTSSYANGPYYLPEIKDNGDALFSILEDFIERIATHSHSGNDSKVITAQFEKNYQTFVSTVDYSWVEISSTGRYSCNINIVGMDIDIHERKFYASKDGGITYKEFYPSYEKIGTTQVKIYSIDNTINRIKIVSF